MSLVPINKTDYESCDALAKASDEEVVKCLPELLTWLQDINWPVASRIIDRISILNEELVSPINEILRGNDGTWKYWIITNLISRSNPTVLIGVKKELLRLVKNPTSDDIKEEVNIVSYEVVKGIGVM